MEKGYQIVEKKRGIFYFHIFWGSLMCLCISLGLVACSDNSIETQKQLNSSTIDTTSANNWIIQAKSFNQTGQYDSAASYFQQAGELYTQLGTNQNDSLIRIKGFRILNDAAHNTILSGDFSRSDSLIQQLILQEGEQLGVAHPIVAHSHKIKGLSYHSQEQYKDALQAFWHSQEIYASVYDSVHTDFANLYSSVGNAYRELAYRNPQLYDSALLYYRVSNGINDKLLDPNLKIVTKNYNEMGLCYLEMDSLELAKEYLEKSLAMRQSLFGESHQDIAESYFCLSSLAERVGNFDHQLELQKKMTQIRKEIFGENHIMYVRSLLTLSNTYSNMVDYEKTLEYDLLTIDHSKAIRGGKHKYLSSGYRNAGVSLYFLGEYETALEYTEKSFTLDFESTKGKYVDSVINFIQYYNNAGNIYIKMGEDSLGLVFFKKALSSLSILVQADNKEGILNHATLFFSLANLYNSMDETDSALHYTDKACDLLFKWHSSNHPFSLDCHNIKGEIYSDIQDYEKSNEFYFKALDASTYLPGIQNSQIAQIYSFIGLNYENLGKPNLALQNLQEGLKKVSLAFDESDFDKNPSISQLTRSIHPLELLIYKGTSLESQAQKSGKVSDLTSAYKTYLLAIELLDEIRKFYSSARSKQILVGRKGALYESAIRVGLELIHKKTTEIDQSQIFSLFEESKAKSLVDIFQENQAKWFGGIPNNLLEKEVDLNKRIIFYREQIKTENAKNNRKDISRLTLWQEKVFDLIQTRDSLLKQFEKNHPTYFQLKHNVELASIEDVQAYLKAKPNTALIEYYVSDKGVLGKTNLFIYVITKDTAFIHEDTTFAGRTESQVTELIQKMGDKEASIEDYKSLSFSLYQRLLEPVLHKIKAKELIIIPDGHLGYVPFEALLTKNPLQSDTSSYLIHDYEIRYEYSATLLLENAKQTQTSSSFIGFAPIYVGNSANTGKNSFSPLANNRAEVESIEGLVGGSIYPRYDATEQKFREIASKAGIIQLALHGFTDDENPLYSGLAFYQDEQTQDSSSVDTSNSISPSAFASSENDGILYAYEIFNMRIPAQLAVLSACQTGTGKFQRGEGIMSLARAFKYAGCPNLVMSLWQVNDRATKDLMELFYKNLYHGMEKDQALRMAKLQYMKDNPHASPYKWASFVMIGDDEPIKFESIWKKHLALWLGVGLISFLLIGIFFFSRGRDS